MDAALTWRALAQVYQVADHIASAGYMVGVPDFFRGNCWSKAKFPPKPEDKFMDWMKGVSDVEGKIMPDFKNALELLQTRGAKGSKAAVVGFCWGGGMALALGSHPKVAAVACVHPSFKMLAGNGFDAANKLQCPIALLPAAGDDVDVVGGCSLSCSVPPVSAEAFVVFARASFGAFSLWGLRLVVDIVGSKGRSEQAVC